MKYLLGLISILFIGGCREEAKNVCKLRTITTLYSIQNMHVGVDTAYGHYVLLNDFSRECIDSLTIVKIAMAYIDTVKFGLPVNGISFFSTDKNFIPNTIEQDPDEINKDCLVDIGFNHKTKKPNSFVFYDNKGERIYWGNCWKPNLK